MVEKTKEKAKKAKTVEKPVAEKAKEKKVPAKKATDARAKVLPKRIVKAEKPAAKAMRPQGAVDKPVISKPQASPAVKTAAPIATAPKKVAPNAPLPQKPVAPMPPPVQKAAPATPPQPKPASVTPPPAPKPAQAVPAPAPKPAQAVPAPTPPPKPSPVAGPAAAPASPPAETAPQEPVLKGIEFPVPITVKDLALRLNVRSNELIMQLMAKNFMVNINQNLAEDMVVQILKERGYEYRKPVKLEDQMLTEHKQDEAKHDIKHLVTRSPVVTFMGHVDHGKTSLLDFIRKTRVADKEKGGITQHIGAYEVKYKNGSVTFLDTPGHAAFTAMRARGANATDVVVLVVAADDGVMPQTKEAIDHARAAKVPIVVAINKCDLPTANLEKVKGQLSQVGLTPEDWGGKTITLPVSAKTGQGVDQLLEMLILESELLELKANPSLRGRGVVVEAKLSSGQGPVSTVLVKNGTLRLGDMMLSGMYYGRVKAMIDDKGQRIEAAPPSKPVSILGLSGVPMAGDEFFVVKDEKKARVLSTLKQDEERSKKINFSKRVTLEGFYRQMKEGVAKELAILIKGDVQGSIEALQKSLFDLTTKDVKVNIIHSNVGNINESDIMLAVVANAVVIGFNVKIDDGAQAIADKEGIEIKLYGIIYEAIQDVLAAMEGLLEPVSKEVFVGRAVVKQVFKVSKAGTIAGCQVAKGKIIRSGMAKLIRNKEIVFQGKVASLKRFKDDAREVLEGFECGIGFDRHDDIKEGDIIEVHTIEKVARRLDARKQ